MTLKGRSALFWGVKKLALDWTSVLARPFTFCSLPGLEHGVSAKGRKRGRVSAPAVGGPPSLVLSN